MLLGGLGSYPPYFRRLREINRLGPGLYGPEPPPLVPLGALGVGEVRRLTDGGALIVDARPVAAFAAGHVPGSISIPLRDQFATWLGWLAGAERPLVLVLGSGQDRADLVRQALKIGYEHLAGELAGGRPRLGGIPAGREPVLRDRAGLHGDARRRWSGRA
jgi:rhodanese-related sulfurtransferase